MGAFFYGAGRNDSKYVPNHIADTAVMQETVFPNQFQGVSEVRLFARYGRIAGVEDECLLEVKKPFGDIACIGAFLKGIRCIHREYSVNPSFHHRGRRSPAVWMNNDENVRSSQELYVLNHHWIRCRLPT